MEVFDESATEHPPTPLTRFAPKYLRQRRDPFALVCDEQIALTHFQRAEPIAVGDSACASSICKRMNSARPGWSRSSSQSAIASRSVSSSGSARSACRKGLSGVMAEGLRIVAAGSPVNGLVQFRAGSVVLARRCPRLPFNVQQAAGGRQEGNTEWAICDWNRAKWDSHPSTARSPGPGTLTSAKPTPRSVSASASACSCSPCINRTFPTFPPAESSTPGSRPCPRGR